MSKTHPIFNTLMMAPLTMGPSIAHYAHAEIYMSEEGAAKSLFPDLEFKKTEFTLNKDLVEQVEKACGETVRSPNLKIFKAANKDTVFIDQVLGKHEFITYAVGIDNQGRVKGVEILEYRETYGNQVKEDNWKKQFVGKTSDSPLKLNQDIKAISGATLSSAHVTAGVRRLLHTYESIKAQL
jgi:Na+-translocating ferredoxin:NAD+ oxidoreductase RnfG subunit